MRGIKVIQNKTEPITAEKSSALIPCYVGQAPIWQVDNVNWQNLAGKTLLISTTEEMREKAGYFVPEKGIWGKEFSLCAAAKYNLEVMLKAPIALVINKEAVPVKAEKISAEITFAKGVAKIESEYVVLSSLTIEGKEKGIDFTAAYDENGRYVILTEITEIGSATASYSVVDAEKIAFNKDTFEEFDFFEQEIGIVPVTILCPLWEKEVVKSSELTVAEMLEKRIEEPMNQHWYATSIRNLTSEIISEAKTEKDSVDSKRVKATWPYVAKDELIYPMSIVYAATKQMVDMRTDGVPYISASNEKIDMDYLCTADGAKIRLKESDATDLNDNGIATANFSNMQWVTWGVCMSNYNESDKENIAPDELNDVAVQMKDYVSNAFQSEFAAILDKPMTRRQAKDIVSIFQAKLDSLVTMGALVTGEIKFNQKDNPRSAIANGEFVYAIQETNTPPGKAIIGKVSYNAEALDSYYGEENE